MVAIATGDVGKSRIMRKWCPIINHLDYADDTILFYSGIDHQ